MKSFIGQSDSIYKILRSPSLLPRLQRLLGWSERAIKSTSTINKNFVFKLFHLQVRCSGVCTLSGTLCVSAQSRCRANCSELPVASGLTFSTLDPSVTEVLLEVRRNPYRTAVDLRLRPSWQTVSGQPASCKSSPELNLNSNNKIFPK